MSEEVIIDFSNVPLKPLGKKEISQLEMALIIGTLYRPEILELIRDPVERSTWMDSLAIAAAAFARHKAGLTASQIAEELGRSETTIRSHLNQKTKAGKLVAETYEKIRKGELKLVVPFVKAPVATVQEEIAALRAELEKLKEQNRALHEKIEELERSKAELTSALNEKLAELNALKAELEKALSEKDQLSNKLSEVLNVLRKIKEQITSLSNSIDEALTAFQKA